MKGKAKAPTSKASKATVAKRNAEAKKAAKKAVRTTKGNTGIAASAKKGKSVVGQSKNTKKK